MFDEQNSTVWKVTEIATGDDGNPRVSTRQLENLDLKLGIESQDSEIVMAIEHAMTKQGITFELLVPAGSQQRRSS